MDFAASNKEVAKMEAALMLAPHNIALQVELAWALRQRDSARSRAMVENLLTAELTQAQRLRLDLLLIEELLWNNSYLEEATVRVQATIAGFNALNDANGCADAYWLLSWVLLLQGDYIQRRQVLALIAKIAIDPNRRCIAEAALARLDVLKNFAESRQHWLGHFPEDESRHVAASCWVEDFHGLVASIEGNEVRAISYYVSGYTKALDSGQIRPAITLALDIGESFALLHELHIALEWQQRALQMARQPGWWGLTGIALQNCGDTLVKLNKLEAADRMLKEAQLHLSKVNKSRSYACVLDTLASLYAAQCDFDQALDHLQKLEALARTLHQPDLISSALCGKARVFSELGMVSSAEQAGQAALQEANSITNEIIPALLALASIHMRHAAQFPQPSAPLQASTSSQEPSKLAPASTALHYLHRALDLANEVEKYIIPPKLFDALAEEYARLGDGMQAYQYAKQAAQSRAKIYSNDADDRAQALQIAYKLEQDALALENNKRLASEQAQRAVLLERANETLQDLGSIGQQITQHLDAEKVYSVITDYLEHLLQADTILIYLLKHDHIESVHHVEQGQRMPDLAISIADPNSNTARCLREDTEIVLEFPAHARPTIPGTAPKRSALFAPLKIADEVLGVMTIQSTYRERYDVRAQMIFRTLCAYTAIALSNCQTHTALAQAHSDLDSAHRHLQDTQQQLIHQEKMATLGQLIANVAHEINTPISTMKNNSGLITASLRAAFHDLPNMLATFSTTEYTLFVQLFERSVQQLATLSSREERALTRELSAQLQARGVTHTLQHANLLVQLRAQAQAFEYLPLLQRPDSLRILQAALNMSSVYFNASGIETAVANVSKIVFALKSFSRFEQGGEFQTVALVDGIETVLTLYHNQIKKGTELVREFEAIPAVPCLPDELNQVWTNLIHNALQAMQYRGRLTITLRQQGDEAVVAVSDTGCGIPPEHHDKIFKPFFTTKATGEGSGLGLDIVQKIIAKHQGRIDFVSTVGVGTTFSVYLPLHKNVPNLA